MKAKIKEAADANSTHILHRYKNICRLIAALHPAAYRMLVRILHWFWEELRSVGCDMYPLSTEDATKNRGQRDYWKRHFMRAYMESGPLDEIPTQEGNPVVFPIIGNMVFGNKVFAVTGMFRESIMFFKGKKHGTDEMSRFGNHKKVFTIYLLASDQGRY